MIKGMSPATILRIGALNMLMLTNRLNLNGGGYMPIEIFRTRMTPRGTVPTPFDLGYPAGDHRRPPDSAGLAVACPQSSLRYCPPFSKPWLLSSRGQHSRCGESKQRSGDPGDQKTGRDQDWETPSHKHPDRLLLSLPLCGF